MNCEKYFKKNHLIYGVSYKFDFGKWNYNLYKFNNYKNAVKWLNTEEYDFRTRELCSKSKAIKLIGPKKVEKLK